MYYNDLIFGTNRSPSFFYYLISQLLVRLDKILLTHRFGATIDLYSLHWARPLHLYLLQIQYTVTVCVALKLLKCQATNDLNFIFFPEQK